MSAQISVIIPVYKVEPYLKKCIDSIIDQSYKNLEIILVDDGSPDNCGQICDEYAQRDNRIIVIHKQNGGVSDARNVGFNAMHGEYVMFVDSDDWIAPTYIETIMKEGEFDLAVTGYTTVDERGTTIENMLTNCNDVKADRKIFSKLVYGSFFGYSACKMYRRSIVEGSYFQPILLREDFVYNIGIMNRAKKVISLRSVGYYYRQRSDSTLHHRYVGNVPDMLKFPKVIINDFHINDELMNYKLGNYVIKIYLIDCLKKYVYQNAALTRLEKKEEVYSVLKCKEIKNYLKIYKEESKFFVFFTICIKFKFYRLAFEVMWRIFHE